MMLDLNDYADKLKLEHILHKLVVELKACHINSWFVHDYYKC